MGNDHKNKNRLQFNNGIIKYPIRRLYNGNERSLSSYHSIISFIVVQNQFPPTPITIYNHVHIIVGIWIGICIFILCEVEVNDNHRMDWNRSWTCNDMLFRILYISYIGVDLNEHPFKIPQ
jgi:hypothetical protein